MLALIRVILDIALLRSGPQVLPASTALFGLIAAAYIASSVALTALIVADQGLVARSVVGDLAFDLIVLWTLLKVARRAERFVQTTSALFGTSALLNVLLLPAVLVVVAGGDDLAVVGALFSLLALGWGLAILAHVLRHALELDWPKAFVVATSYMFVSMLWRRVVEGA